jgi:hypothetical protein
VLARRLPAPPSLPLSLPSDDDWLLKIISIENRFVLGVYRRQMKAISYLGKIEKLLGVPATTRNWNTIKKVVKLLSQGKNRYKRLSDPAEANVKCEGPIAQINDNNSLAGSPTSSLARRLPGRYVRRPREHTLPGRPRVLVIPQNQVS